MSSKLEIICPCCDTKLQVDQKTGEVLWKEEKKKEFSSLTDMVHDLAEQQKESQSKFKQKEPEKDNARLLAEKFKEAQKNVDKSDTKPLRDFDLD